MKEWRMPPRLRVTAEEEAGRHPREPDTPFMHRRCQLGHAGAASPCRACPAAPGRRLSLHRPLSASPCSPVPSFPCVTAGCSRRHAAVPLRAGDARACVRACPE
nr:hypothetical protein RVX_3133 [Nitratidesulfovibrio sp. HK-II]